jgi:Flagellar assembly protein T, C-terminal domain
VCYGIRRMKPWCLAGLFVVLLVTSGCSSVRQLFGIPNPGEPTINLKSAEAKWLLIKNPRFGDVRSEPEYVWVEEDKLPTTITTLVRGKGAIIAPPEIVAKYGPPPGGGKISPRQGVAYPTTEPGRAPVADPRSGGSAAPAPAPATATAPAATKVAALPVAPAPEAPKRGLVLHVEPTRVVVDLTAADGLQVGQLLSLRHDRIPIVHPTTGEVLGELDDEVGTARVTELRERFSVAEIQSVAAGAQVQVKDRVVPK